jgi:hypothetical protein
MHGFSMPNSMYIWNQENPTVCQTGHGKAMDRMYKRHKLGSDQAYE